nr:circumsporozoite protein-like [Arachis hypogaea]
MLNKIGNVIGRTLRIDFHTADKCRDKFARLCVELNLDEPRISQYSINGTRYYVEYEGLHNICFSCGLFGHERERRAQESKWNNSRHRTNRRTQGLKLERRKSGKSTAGTSSGTDGSSGKKLQKGTEGTGFAILREEDSNPNEEAQMEAENDKTKKVQPQPNTPLYNQKENKLTQKKSPSPKQQNPKAQNVTSNTQGPKITPEPPIIVISPENLTQPNNQNKHAASSLSNTNSQNPNKNDPSNITCNPHASPCLNQNNPIHQDNTQPTPEIPQDINMSDTYVPKIIPMEAEMNEPPDPKPPDMKSIDSDIILKALLQYERRRELPERQGQKQENEESEESSSMEMEVNTGDSQSGVANLA